METVLRLAWALPLVLGVGFLMLLMLKRLVPIAPTVRHTQRLRVHESLPLSEDTRVHLIEADGDTYLVVESTRQAALQPARRQAGATPAAALRLTPAWVQRLGMQRR